MNDQDRDAPGYSLAGLLVIVVVLGLLTATAIVGVNALTDDNSGGIRAISPASTTRAPASPGNRGGSGGSGRIAAGNSSAASSCQASADAARAAGSVFYANSGGRYPTTWTDLTSGNPPIFELATGVIVTPGNSTQLEGAGWKLTMKGGGTVAPTFTCTGP